MKNITYNLDVARRIMGECFQGAENTCVGTSNMRDSISQHYGKVQTHMSEIVEETENASLYTRDLFKKTAIFIRELTDYLEQQEREIAARMKE